MRFIAVICLLCVAALPTIISASNQSDDKKTCCSCAAGTPGIPGHHGNPGGPGRDGRDGRNGVQGPAGSPGPKGPPGSCVNNGKPGARGPEGHKGSKGDRGPAGPPGPSSHTNWKECVWKNMNEGKDNGLIRDCVFYKNRTDTVLFVYWNGDFRVTGCTNCCKRWFFTFNGAECKSPAAIDGVVHPAGGIAKARNVHQVRTIQGHCDKIHPGHVRVGFNVGNCAGFGTADAYTGWNSVSRVYIEEVTRSQP